MVRRLRSAIWEAEIAMKQANTARRMEGEWAGLGMHMVAVLVGIGLDWHWLGHFLLFSTTGVETARAFVGVPFLAVEAVFSQEEHLRKLTNEWVWSRS